MAMNNYGYGSGGGGQWQESDIGSYNPRLHYQAAKVAGFELSAADAQPKTVYIGNLDPSITEEFINTLFGQIGPVKKTKLMFDGGMVPYAFVEFADHYTATQCVQAMNKRMLMGKEMKVNWATEHAPSQPKIDTSNHFHVFVGDLSPEIDNKTLQEAFARFGEISDTKVIRDMQTLKTKGYGFVSYPVREQAERAIEQMNGQWLGNRPVRTNWATRKPVVGESNYYSGKQAIEEIYSQTGPENTSVYVGTVPQNSTEDDIRMVFKQFGDILDIRHFQPQGYAFVRYATKESAAKAIAEMNGAQFLGQTIRCSWGKSEVSSASAGRADLPSYGSGAFNPGNVSDANAANMQAYWNYYQQYYNSNPELQQQWQSYWEQQQKAQQQGT